MKRLSLLVFVVSWINVFSQQFMPLYPPGKMPNSKGLKLTDSIFDERIRRVGTPGIYQFLLPNHSNKGTAILICPGGGYSHISYISSGFDIARWFNSLGINAFVLQYRLPHSPDLVDRSIAPLQDVQRAIRMIRTIAFQWGIDKGKIGVMGISAGGHVASMAGTQSEDVSKIGDNPDAENFYPNFMILLSPVITMGEKTHKGSRDNLLGKNPSQELIWKFSSEKHVNEHTPTALMFHAYDDKSVDPENSIMFYEALREKKINASIHIFPSGGHSIGLGKNPGSTQLWMNLTELWLKEINALPLPD